MGEYFKPLRRKFGVLTLALACLLAAGWFRSRFYVDTLYVKAFSESPEALISFSKGLVWMHQGIADPRHMIVRGKSPKFIWIVDSDESAFATADWQDDVSMAFRFRRVGPSNSRAFRIFASYAMIVPPLACLAAWLLLSRRRQPAISKSSEETAA